MLVKVSLKKLVERCNYNEGEGGTYYAVAYSSVGEPIITELSLPFVPSIGMTIQQDTNSYEIRSVDVYLRNSHSKEEDLVQQVLCEAIWR